MENEVVTKARGDPGAGRSAALDLSPAYILRRPYLNIQNALLLGTSQYLSAGPWRVVLYSSPVVWACVKALNDQLVALPWHITTRDKAERHRKKALIDYYTHDVVEVFNGENYDTGMMRLFRDVLTIPQGGNCEVVFKTAGRWKGEVDRVENIDGGTLTPTGNYEFPLIQRDPYNWERAVVFKREQVRRILMNPRPEHQFAGYQQAPLEMCYLAIDALSKGDFYYLNLLNETPTAGILDLADFKKDEAIVWAKSWRELLTGSETMKIPVLYEHEKEARWIPFGEPPERLLLNDSMARYTRLVHANFGLYTQDTGLTEDELAGGRQSNLERRSWHRFNVMVAFAENFWNSIINPDLVLKYEEVNVEETERLARAAVAKANALGILMRAGALGIREVRREASETGLIETYINTEEIPEDTMTPGLFGGGINPVITGQSRWPEQRLPEEGRRQALPAPKMPQGEETRQRIRPKSQAQTASLTAALETAFHKIAVDIPEEDLQQLIKDAGVLLVAALRETKSLSDDAHVRWLEEFDRLMDNEEGSLIKAKALIRKRRQSTEAIEQLLKANGWWDITDAELFATASRAFKAAYEDALDELAEEIQQALYEQGFVDSPMPDDYAASLVNSIIAAEIDAYGQNMIAKLNTGTEYYLKHALSRAITRHLSQPEIRARIHEGENAAEIIAIAGLIDDIAATFKADLLSLVGPRAMRAADYELANIVGSARWQAMKSMGLTMKQWVDYGPDPCVICIKNAALGPVPLDHEYESVFGYCLWPLAHPNGHCGITFDREELFAIINSGGEITLYRGE